jgi:CheY-like chemotaxis protein
MEKKKVLIIDDDARNIFALKATLKAKGYDCIACSGATEALAFCKRQSAVTILIDMMMPEMDGYEAIPLMKKIENRQTNAGFCCDCPGDGGRQGKVPGSGGRRLYFQTD